MLFFIHVFIKGENARELKGSEEESRWSAVPFIFIL